MAKTPTNATEYLKSLLGMKTIFFFNFFILSVLDFATEKIPPTKHKGTPCKFRRILCDFNRMNMNLVYILATAGLRFLPLKYSIICEIS